MNETPLYLGSVADARAAGELSLWKESFQANIQCRDAIENEIRQGFDGMHLDGSCATRVIREYGFERVQYVLAATLQRMNYDGRFSPVNMLWAKTIPVTESVRNIDFAIRSHPAVLNGFVDQYRAEFALHLAAKDSPDLVPMSM